MHLLREYYLCVLTVLRLFRHDRVRAPQVDFWIEDNLKKQQNREYCRLRTRAPIDMIC